MLTQPVQSTVFIVDVVPIPADEDQMPVGNEPPDCSPDCGAAPSNQVQDPGWWCTDADGHRRLRVRERYTYVVPEASLENEVEDPCQADLICQHILEIDGHRDRHYEITREVELAYEKIGPGNISIFGDSLHFDDAGLRIMTRACGPAYVDRNECQLRSSVIEKAVVNFLQTSGKSGRQNNFLNTAFGEDCYHSLFEGGNQENIEGNSLKSTLSAILTRWLKRISNQVKSKEGTLEATQDNRRRVYYFHTEACFPEPAKATQADKLAIKAVSEVMVVPQRTDSPLTEVELADAKLRPIIWFPFVNEAFAFAAVTGPNRFRLLGRMGAMTHGYRITDDFHWQVNIKELRPLTFAEDILPDGSGKFAEFDAGALPPGDCDMGLDIDERIDLWRDPVPFFIGAMPLDDPQGFDHKDLDQLHKSRAGNFCYLEGKLNTPIIFDPVVNCGSCPG
jgi:hypothetical protein